MKGQGKVGERHSEKNKCVQGLEAFWRDLNLHQARVFEDKENETKLTR